MKAVSALLLLGLAVLLSSGVRAGTLGSRLEALAKGNTALVVPAGSRQAASNPFAPGSMGLGG